MSIKASELDYKNLAAYFVDGITWSRLRDIATQDPQDGGHLHSGFLDSGEREEATQLVCLNVK